MVWIVTTKNDDWSPQHGEIVSGTSSICGEPMDKHLPSEDRTYFHAHACALVHAHLSPPLHASEAIDLALQFAHAFPNCDLNVQQFLQQALSLRATPAGFDSAQDPWSITILRLVPSGVRLAPVTTTGGGKRLGVAAPV
jgi:hypothetical protein